MAEAACRRDAASREPWPGVVARAGSDPGLRMQIAPFSTSAEEPAPGSRHGQLPAHRRDRRSAPDSERPLASAVEPALRVPSRVHPIPAPAGPRWIEPERDYRAPTPSERARLLRAAYEASATDPEQQLLLAELMAHYRAWCLRNGKGDPFAALSHDQAAD